MQDVEGATYIISAVMRASPWSQALLSDRQRTTSTGTSE
jgi:hypothetical protein